MAAVTPKEILAISETLESVYQRTTDELLINISKHFATETALRTRWWEIKKLSELGALTEESVRIIARNTGIAPAEIRKAFLAVAENACLDIDPQLANAAKQGLLQDPGTDTVTSPAIQSMLQSYIRQSVDKCNLVNTTMLQSTQAAYRKAVADTVMIDAQLSKAQDVLNSATGTLVAHTDTRQQAIRYAMNQMSDAGLTGFYDRAGRKWSPEAYVAMDIRTTAHNVAIDSIKTRQAEYGSDIFQVSAHAGARPLCYPYQNKFYSWGGSGGTFPDGNGDLHTYEPVSSTSYGQAAGLFGINCGHHPRVVIPGMTIPHDMPEQPKATNDQDYISSQQQRALERKIREAKRKEEIARASKDGDTEAASARVNGAQAQMRQFISQTGRQRRYDREQVGGTVTVTDTIGRSVGAKAKNYNIFNPVSGQTVHLTEGTHITQPKNHIIAGKGREREIDELNLLLDKYGGDALRWTKEKGFGFITDEYGESHYVELHWYQEPSVGKAKMKIKVQPDGRVYLDKD